MKCNFKRKTSALRCCAPLEFRGKVLCLCYADWKARMVDFILVLIELFRWYVKAEVLRANINWKSVFPLQQWQFGPKFQVEDAVPTVLLVRKLGWIIFHVVKMCMGTSFFRFITIHAFYRQTEGQKGLGNTVHCTICISRTVKTLNTSLAVTKRPCDCGVGQF